MYFLSRQFPVFSVQFEKELIMSSAGYSNLDRSDLLVRNQMPSSLAHLGNLGWSPRDLERLRDPEKVKQLLTIVRGLGKVALHPNVVDADQEPEYFLGSKRGTVHHTKQGVMKVEVSEKYGLLLNDCPVQLLNLSRAKYSACTIEQIMQRLAELKRVPVNATVLDFLLHSRRNDTGVDLRSLCEAWRTIFKPPADSGKTPGHVFFLGTKYEHTSYSEVRSLVFDSFRGELTGSWWTMSEVVPPNSAVALLAPHTKEELGWVSE